MYNRAKAAISSVVTPSNELLSITFDKPFYWEDDLVSGSVELVFKII